MSFEEIATDCWVVGEDVVALLCDMNGDRIFDPFWDPAQTLHVEPAYRNNIREGQDAYALDSWIGRVPDPSWGIWLQGPYSGANPRRTAALARDLVSKGYREVFNLTPAAIGSNYWALDVWPHATAIVCMGRYAFHAGRTLTASTPKGGTVVHERGQRVYGNRHEIALVYYGERAEELCESVHKHLPLSKQAKGAKRPIFRNVTIEKSITLESVGSGPEPAPAKVTDLSGTEGAPAKRTG